MKIPIRRMRKSDIEWLAENTCKKHRHNYLQHYECFIKEKPDTSPFKERVGYLDIESTGLKGNWDYMLCVTPDHKILTEGFNWVPIGDVEAGKRIIAFDEFPVTKGGRRFRYATVEATRFAKAKTYLVELSNGEVIKTTADHKWLSCYGEASNQAWKWIETSRLASSKDGSRSTRLCRVIPVVDFDRSFESGYISAIIDGEGWISDRGQIGFAQNSGRVLDRAINFLGHLGVPFSSRLDSRKPTINQLLITGGIDSYLSLIQRTRPTKLWNIEPNDMARIEAKKDREIVYVRGVYPGPTTDIVQIKTSSGTMVIDGYPMHNCWCIKEAGGKILGRHLKPEEITGYKFDKYLTSELITAIRGFDRIITYYGIRFDIPFIKTRCEKWGLDFPAYRDLWQTDVYFIAKANLLLHSTRLMHVCDLLGIPSKEHKLIPDIWMKAKSGHVPSLEWIFTHCKEDVISLELAHDRLKKYTLPQKRSI